MKKSVALKRLICYIYICAGVVKLADALDSKSCGLIIRVGSSPTTGTKRENNLAQSVGLFFYGIHFGLPKSECHKKHTHVVWQDCLRVQVGGIYTTAPTQV